MNARPPEHRKWLAIAPHWWWSVLTIAALHYATLMVLPLTLIQLGNGFVAVPIVAGFILEVMRSAVRRRLRRKVRATFLRGAALQALDKRALVPEADVDSAFWAAQLTEQAITIDLPALTAAALAALCILVLSAPAIGSGSIGLLVALSSFLLALGAWSNKRRASGLDALVEQRQRSAGWIAAAERDGGEIYGDRARRPFLTQITRAVQEWSSAEDRVEREHLQHRLMLGAFFIASVLLFLRVEHVDPRHLELAHGVTVHGVPGLLLLGTGAPIAYVFAIHADSLLTAHAALKQLRPQSAPPQLGERALDRRPSHLAARALSFSYTTLASTPRRALHDVTLDIDLEKLILVCAPNGAGKTTLARLLCGVLTPTSGALEIDGIPCRTVSRDDFGFVPQNPLIVETLTIEENVRLVAPEATPLAISEMLLELGLQRPNDQLAASLSRGEQRRIAIARAILKKPRLLLLDEPDVWLDDNGRLLLARVLQRELATRAVIVISHRRDWLSDSAHVVELPTA